MFKGLGNLASLMKHAQQMGGRLNSIQEELKSHRVNGSSGGGDGLGGPGDGSGGNGGGVDLGGGIDDPLVFISIFVFHNS